MAITSSRRVVAGLAVLGVGLTGFLIVTQHGSQRPPTAIYTGARDGTITSCQVRDYTTARAVDIKWQVTNHDSKPHDYRVFIDAAPRFEKEVDLTGLAPQYAKAGYLTIPVAPAQDGSWPVINCTITAVAS